MLFILFAGTLYHLWICIFEQCWFQDFKLVAPGANHPGAFSGQITAPLYPHLSAFISLQWLGLDLSYFHSFLRFPFWSKYWLLQYFNTVNLVEGQARKKIPRLNRWIGTRRNFLYWCDPKRDELPKKLVSYQDRSPLLIFGWKAMSTNCGFIRAHVDPINERPYGFGLSALKNYLKKWSWPWLRA